MIWLALVVAIVHGAPKEQGVDCAQCHATSGWADVHFDHERTRLPLRGRHAMLPCASCHANHRTLATDPRCMSCHSDPHAGRLGAQCAQCHSQESFRNPLGVQVHGRTRFPLNGRHLWVPCDECHQNKGDRTFGGVPIRCFDCHGDEYFATGSSGFNHEQFGIGRRCRMCHTPNGWLQAAFAEHERCFPLSSGPHRKITCLGCHVTLTQVRVADCSSMTVSCIRCHSCSKMDKKHRGESDAVGYECIDRKCYQCHPKGKE